LPVFVLSCLAFEPTICYFFVNSIPLAVAKYNRFLEKKLENPQLKKFKRLTETVKCAG